MAGISNKMFCTKKPVDFTANVHFASCEFFQEFMLMSSTGWISKIWKKVQVNILKEPLVLLKQTIPQQKDLDLSFNLSP